MSLQGKPPSFTLLPDEITINYLARIPRSYYPTFSIVSKSFYSLLSSNDLYAERSLLGNTEQCLYVCLRDRNSETTQWFTLWSNPNRTLHNSSMNNKKKEKLLVRIRPSNFPLLPRSNVTVVGSEIYVIGGLVDGAPSSTVRILDCRSHTWRDAPSMNVARGLAASCFYNGKIYVIGGYRKLEYDVSWAEVFDIKTQTWERLSYPDIEICMVAFFQTSEIEGKIYVSYYPNFVYAYDTKQGKWESCNDMIFTYPRPMCVIENVSYSCGRDRTDGHLTCWWYDTNAQNWRVVRGLSSLRDKCLENSHYMRVGLNILVSYDGKLLPLWGEVEMKNQKKKIWCAEIAVEKRDGDEVWGTVEWVDIIDSIPNSHPLSHLVAVSV